MNKAEFFDELTQCAEKYDNDNQWFGFQRGGPSWSQGTWIQFILAAWKLYQNASNNQLQMVLLGDTKIRSDPALLLNFGLVANTNTPQEDSDKQMVSQLMQQRRGIAGGSQFNAVDMMGPGSILSAKRWSPMLNDSLMLAGIKAKQDFHFALNVDEQAVWRQLTTQQRPMTPAFAQRVQQFGAIAARDRINMNPKQTWLQFLLNVHRVLWEDGRPRVFVRELMGLKLFGYKPVFTMHELGFIYQGGGQPPTFQNYLNGLRDVGMERCDRLSIIRSISEFLFDDPQALASVGA